jgi:hypothetical protein
MKNRLSIYQIGIIIGVIISAFFQIMRFTGDVDMTLLQTLIPIVISYMAILGTFIVAFIYGVICGILDIDIN